MQGGRALRADASGMEIGPSRDTEGSADAQSKPGALRGSGDS